MTDSDDTRVWFWVTLTLALIIFIAGIVLMEL